MVVINQECLSFIHKIALLPSDRVEMVINPNPEAGRFSSINAGLAVLTGTNPAFIQNVDNPFVNEALLRLLVHSLKEYDGVCPAFQHKGGHPLLLSEKLVNNLKSMDNNLDFKQYLKGFDIHKQEVSDTAVLANINTVDEYKQWFSAT